MASMTPMASQVRLPARASRAAVKVVATARPQSTTKAARAGLKLDQFSLLATTSLLLASPARAEEAAGVDGAVDSLISVVKAAGGAVKTGISALQAGVGVLKEGYDAAAPVVESAYKAAAPVVEQAVKVTGEVAAPAIKAALPALEGTVSQTSKVLQSSGLSVKQVTDATATITQTANTGITAVTPVFNQFVNFVTTTDPVVLAEYGAGLAAAYFLTPAVLGLVFGSFRGFAGELTAAAALDSIVNEGGCVLIDIRTASEKVGSGIPDVPSGAGGKILEVEYAVTEDKKLRSQLRNPSDIEAQVTALQIASLKKIGKGSKIILLDRYGPAAKSIAKELARKGYGKVFLVAGGFDGRGGWVQSKLQIKPAAPILAPSSSFAKTISTRGSRALPAPKA